MVQDNKTNCVFEELVKQTNAEFKLQRVPGGANGSQKDHQHKQRENEVLQKYTLHH